MQIKKLEHHFVADIPTAIENGKLYVSMEYATAIHSCCCGCGEEVVTPLTPTDWSMTFDGETISLHPSVGNWDLPCRSHYFVRRGQVVEAPRWGADEIEKERGRDRAAKLEQFGGASKLRKQESPAEFVSLFGRIWAGFRKKP